MDQQVSAPRSDAPSESPFTARPVRRERGGLANLPPTVCWVGGADGALELLDQTLLPGEVAVRRCVNIEQVIEAIQQLCVRGAPAIGVAGAYGVCLGSRNAARNSAGEFREAVLSAAHWLKESRPTAVNLAWAVDRVAKAATPGTPAEAWSRMLLEADQIVEEEVDACRRIGEAGAELVRDGSGVLTHCNAGALATIAYGTALAPLYVAAEAGRKFRVYADETRPLLQGSRLTAFELSRCGLDVTVLPDGAAASLLANRKVDLVIVGADRIAANGDTANKVGTYPLALAAAAHNVPFFVAAPLSTFDLFTPSGAQIPIEQRRGEELARFGDFRIAPYGIKFYNPAFDVTPVELIRGFVTPKGILSPISSEKIREILV
ncbi:MAG: S-methyl-5-thioribose-1-phosphate isomerase [Planctomycetes bacterium]|nr:S-methyl-5-thioribose-1-phosphate isomerase [Planctomycetota bacterium]